MPFVARTTTTLYCSNTCRNKFNKRKSRSKKIDESNKESIAQINFDLEQIKAKDYLSLLDVSVLLGVSKRTLYRVVEQKNIALTKIAGRTIIRRIDLDNFFKKNDNH
jgi:excisionase family DNA binding protein